MCGRFALVADPATVATHFALAELPALEPRYNIAPTQAVAVIRQSATAADPLARELVWLRWGLVPHWAPDPSAAARMINARAETVAVKPAFRAAFRQRRCLLPASGFYEWQATAGGKGKQPYYFSPPAPSADQPAPLWAFAGLWEQWRAQDGSILETCTIITTEANPIVQPIHARMPVILPPHAYALWLDPSLHDLPALTALLQPAPASAVQSRTVSTRVNSPRHDDAQCLV